MNSSSILVPLRVILTLMVGLFLMPEAYAKLRPKFEKELKPGARVMSYVWPIPGWESEQVDAQEGRATIFLYKRPSL